MIRRTLHSGLGWLSLLALANIFYIGWAWTLESPEPAPTTLELPNTTPTIRLLSEIDLAATDSAMGHILEEVSQPAMEVVCRTWGPFSDEADITAIRAQIDHAGGDSTIHQSRVADEPDYLVYVGQRGRAENVRRVLEELKSQSIDSALITRGPFNNTLSVGVFSRAGRAESQRERVAKLGYEVTIEEIDRSYSVYHLEARVPVGFEPTTPSNGPCTEIAQAH